MTPLGEDPSSGPERQRARKVRDSFVKWAAKNTKAASTSEELRVVWVKEKGVIKIATSCVEVTKVFIRPRALQNGPCIDPQVDAPVEIFQCRVEASVDAVGLPSQGEDVGNLVVDLNGSCERGNRRLHIAHSQVDFALERMSDRIRRIVREQLGDDA
ncbi:MAG: hypothetical protein AAGE52_22315 [Myxococcota bacterium]